MDGASRDRILSEQMLSRLDAIQELVKDVPEIKDRLGRVELLLDGVEGTLALHTEVLREHSADLKEIKQIVGGQMESVAELQAVSHSH